MSEAHHRSATAGERAAEWRRCLESHQRWLRTVVLTRLRDPHATEDVLQEVALAVAAGPPDQLPLDKAAPWLYRVAVRQVLLYRRRMGRRRALHQRIQDRLPTTVEEDPLQWLLAEERQQLVRDAVAQLSPRDSQVLLMKYMEGWSYQEIAERLGISASAVEARLHRARARLRQRLGTLQPAIT